MERAGPTRIDLETLDDIFSFQNLRIARRARKTLPYVLVPIRIGLLQPCALSLGLSGEVWVISIRNFLRNAARRCCVDEASRDGIILRQGIESFLLREVLSWLKQDSGLSHHSPRVFVVAQRHVLRVPQLVRSGPFCKVDPDHGFCLDPGAGFHLLRRQSLTPAAGFILRQIREGALGDLEPFELGEHLTARRGYETGADSACKQEILPSIESDDQRIEGDCRACSRRRRIPVPG